MERKDFLRAMAVGAGAVAVPFALLKEEEEFTVTSEDGRTAWDEKGNQVWQEKTTLTELLEGAEIQYDFPAASNIKLPRIRP